MKRTLCFLIAAAVGLGLLGGCTPEPPTPNETVTVVDAEGNRLASFDRLDGLAEGVREPALLCYVQIAVNEAITYLMTADGLDQTAAAKALFAKPHTLHTAMQQTAYESMVDGMESAEQKATYAAAATDLHGKLIAAVSGGDATRNNYAFQKTAPYSAFKPLSLYAPAIEQGRICWSTVYFDGPVKQVTDETGRTTPWPANATNSYAQRNIPVAEAIAQSLNTVAVRCLQEIGVNETIRYTEQTFGLSLQAEKNRAMMLGEDEVLGNIALGYLEEGISPVEMAGYYQIFATGGRYTAPQALQKLTVGEETVYTYRPETKAIISESTADVMNRMLQEVVSVRGTAAAAAIDGVAVGGKSGTGTDNVGNWFVGFTPEYCCAVWRGAEVTRNDTAGLFSAIVGGFPLDKTAAYPPCRNVRRQAFCRSSGLLMGTNCTDVDLGWFDVDHTPAVCDKCE
ncbi:MAG: penicillin-binding protein [Clostridia bacterium]|nr:penicillin-binding protein [Clostridia bacterium]